jgi:hypothetical protein
MVDDKISSTLGVRSLADAQAEDTSPTDTDAGIVRGFGSNREQSQTDEDRQQSSQIQEELQLETDKEAERPSKTQDDIEITNGEVQIVEDKETGIVPIENNDENLKDIEYAKQNVKNIIDMGDDAVKEMLAIAKQSESARAFEVVSTLMKTVLDANKDFVDLSSKKKFAEDEQKYGKPETNITNNNLIVSTADLLKMIKGDG